MGKTLDEYMRDVREDMNDFPEVNRLLDNNTEFSEKAVERACKKALSRFNNMPPPIGDYTYTTFPDDATFVDLAIVMLLSRATIYRGRETLQYSDAGLAIDDQNFKEYITLLRDLRQEAYGNAKALKRAINAGRAWGRVSSPYSNLGDLI